MKFFPDRSGGKTGRAGSNRQAKNVEPGFLRQGRQSSQSLLLFYISRNTEI